MGDKAWDSRARSARGRVLYLPYVPYLGSLVPRPFPFLRAHAKHKCQEKSEFFLALVFRVYQAHVKTGKAWERGYLHTVLLVLYGAALHHMDHVTICNTIWSTVSCHLWIMWLVREAQYYITGESCDQHVQIIICVWVGPELSNHCTAALQHTSWGCVVMACCTWGLLGDVLGQCVLCSTPQYGLQSIVWLHWVVNMIKYRTTTALVLECCISGSHHLHNASLEPADGRLNVNFWKAWAY